MIPSRNIDFDPFFYRDTYTDVAASGHDPWQHYDIHGRREGRYPTSERLAGDVEILTGGTLFDPSYYRAISGIGDDVSAATHYLVHGALNLLDPAPDFEEGLFRPYFATIGEYGPAAITDAALTIAGWPVFRTGHLRETARRIADSERFDVEYYRSQPGVPGQDLDPILHYILVGERLGLNPNAEFDVGYYGFRHRDVFEHRINMFAHYLECGEAEGRIAKPSSARHFTRPIRLDPKRETVLVSAHQASRTGAPILGYNIMELLKKSYNVILILMDGGDLLSEFETLADYVVGPMSRDEWDATECAYLIADLVSCIPLKYAIINSIECRMFIPALTENNVPTITLMHEFACYTRPLDTMIEAMDLSSVLIFPAEVVRESAEAAHPWLKLRQTHIMPQGQSALPKSETGVGERIDEMTAVDAEAIRIAKGEAALRAKLRPPGCESSLLILGCGSVHLRKGVDLFIATAGILRRQYPDMDVRFVWIGHGYDPHLDTPYSVYLAEQMNKMGVADDIVIIGEVDDLEPAYREADIFFLSSRLDPLPNVAIDAAMWGKPVLCFDDASGMSRILATDAVAASMVVPYADPGAAADRIAQLAERTEDRHAIGEATAILARRTFDMVRYVSEIDRLGVEAGETMSRRQAALQRILADPGFDEGYFLPASSVISTRAAAIRWFLIQNENVGTTTGAAINPHFRRPAPGFNPQCYAVSAMPAGHGEDAYAHYLASGRPDGPWQRRVLPPMSMPTSVPTLKTALHVHLFHPELVTDVLAKLKVNASPCDLFISTRDADSRTQIETALRSYDGGTVMVRVFPNIGRDIGPMLTGFRSELSRYDIVGHVHGKRSTALGDMSGEIWREFLLQHLVGDMFPMLDTALQAFANDETLGLVFPADPHLSDWNDNHSSGMILAENIGIDRNDLPVFFDFPIGMMFWARRAALAPLFDLDLDWNDYPLEPLPYDGTMLHAIERMVPIAAEHAGFGLAVTHVPGIGR